VLSQATTASPSGAALQQVLVGERNAKVQFTNILSHDSVE
jgi:hypothetical protein